MVIYRLDPDATVSLIPEGIRAERSGRYCLIPGARALYGLFHFLAPPLRDGATPEELLSAIPPSHRATARRMLAELIAAGIVVGTSTENGPETRTNSSSDALLTGSQVFSPELRDAVVLLSGTGRGLDAAIGELRALGIEKLGGGGEEPPSNRLPQAHLHVLVQDGVDRQAIDESERVGVEASVPLLQAVLAGTVGLIARFDGRRHPLQEAIDRLAQDSVVCPGAAVDVPPALASLVAALLASEAAKVILGLEPGVGPDDVLVVDADSLEVTRRTVPPRPQLTVVGPDASGLDGRTPAWRGEGGNNGSRRRGMSSTEHALSGRAGLFDEWFGLVSAPQTEPFAQVPLSMAVSDVRGPRAEERSRPVCGFGFTEADAREAAVLAGLRTLLGQVIPEGLAPSTPLTREAEPSYSVLEVAPSYWEWLAGGLRQLMLMTYLAENESLEFVHQDVSTDGLSASAQRWWSVLRAMRRDDMSLRSIGNPNVPSLHLGAVVHGEDCAAVAVGETPHAAVRNAILTCIARLQAAAADVPPGPLWSGPFPRARGVDPSARHRGWARSIVAGFRQWGRTATTVRLQCSPPLGEVEFFVGTVSAFER